MGFAPCPDCRRSCSCRESSTAFKRGPDCAPDDMRVLSSIQLPVVPLWLLSYLAARGGAAANDCERRYGEHSSSHSRTPWARGPDCPPHHYLLPLPDPSCRLRISD